MAPLHLLAPTTFAIKNINPSMVKPKPRGFRTKGNANRAIKVKTRFFQLISAKEKAGFSSWGPLSNIDRRRLTIAKNPRSEAARKVRRPDPGDEKVPREASNEETIIATAKRRKKTLLF